MDSDAPLRTVAALLLITMVAVVLPYRIRAHRAGGTPSRREEGALFLPLRLAGLVVYGVAIAWMINPRSVALASVPLPEWVRWTGAALVGASVILLGWVFSSLGLNVTDTVVVREKHTLVTTGPYRFVRHPLYAAMIPSLCGLSLLTANVVVALGSVAAGMLIGRRTLIEEAKLVERYGTRYLEYARRTPRYLPRLGPPPSVEDSR